MVRSQGNLISAAKASDPESIEARIWRPLPTDESFNSPRWRSAEIPLGQRTWHGARCGTTNLMQNGTEAGVGAESLIHAVFNG